MSKKWTRAQQTAIDTRGKTLLVSAAAGSGKTATLTERIIRRITDTEAPADISEMLIVTFTRAAAAELKARIFSALNDALANAPTNKHIASQLLKLGSAKISTIDSFYYDLIKENSSTLGLSSSMRIADDAEYMLIAHDAMEASVNAFYEKTADFPAFVECFAGTKQINTVSDIFLDIYQKLESLPQGIEFLAECASTAELQSELDFFRTDYGKILKQNCCDCFEHYKKALFDAVEFAKSDEKVFKAYGEQLIYDLDFCNRLYDAAKSPDDGYLTVSIILQSYSPAALKPLSSKSASELSSAYKDMRKEFKDKLLDMQKNAFSKSPDSISRAMKDTAKHISTLYLLLKCFEDIVGEEKSRLGIMTFADIRRHTLTLLVKADGTPTDLARRYAEQYSEIYIDEYQDVDRVQDLIFTSLSRPDNRFMVGDIKQSIYSFRGSEPQLFADYRARFPASGSTEAERSEAVSVFMSDNFRCDKPIIDFANLVCSKLFEADKESIGYTPEDDLRCSKLPPSENYTPKKVKLSLITAPRRTSKDEPSSREKEAEYVADQIQNLLKSGKLSDGSPILPCHIAVLYRSRKIGPYIAAALKKRDIQSTDSDALKYFEDPDVLMMLCLLNAVDNPERDTFMAGTLRSPVFGFSMDDLISIRIGADFSHSMYSALCKYAEENSDELSERCKSFMLTLDEWRKASVAMPVDAFLRMLFDSERFAATGLVSQVREDGTESNLLLLYEFARGFERNGFKGLYQFIEYINSMLEKGKTFPLGERTASGNRVSLMSIHKSKGLEFPVCFICEAGASIRSKDIKNSLVFEYPSGIAMKLSAADGFARINTPMREAVISQIAQNQSREEIRILYVALTRAREQLYITSATSKTRDTLLDGSLVNIKFFDRYTLLHLCSSYLDWILLCCGGLYGDSFEIDFPTLLQNSDEENAESEPEEKKFLPDEQLVRRLNENFDFSYPYAALSSVPSKLSVSRLYPGVLDEEADALEVFAESPSTTVPDFFLPDSPTRATAAERGTATHLFLQFCNFEYAVKHGAREELARLLQLKFLPQNSAELTYIDELEAFMRSELLERILSAKRVIREQRFNVQLAPNGFTENQELLEELQEERLAVQGVIDLILISADGELELYDYKTDRLSAYELRDSKLAQRRLSSTHGAQLSYYAKAAELLFGKPCSRICVYSTHSAQLYDIEPSAKTNLF